MPDAHAGAGCVIGFTGDLGDKIIPNIVGVDISCGMLTFELGKRIIDLPKLDRFIKSNIPYSYNVYKEKQIEYDGISKMKCYRHLSDVDRLERSIGTLGGGITSSSTSTRKEASIWSFIPDQEIWAIRSQIIIKPGLRNWKAISRRRYEDLCYLTDKERKTTA